MRNLISIVVVFVLVISKAVAQPTVHRFEFDQKDFLLDGKPYQIISGEMHPARIPAEYWKQRIQMAKALGCNTIAAYIFWNYHEISEGVFDFKTWNRDISGFIKIAQEEGMWVIIRPGPYVCAEWDFGGLPSYLLKIPDIKVRCMDSQYMAAVEKYVAALSAVIKPLQVNRGGPVLMLQIENEYGSFGNDRNYLQTLANLWRRQGMDIPFYTADGPAPFMLEAGSLSGCASGLDSGFDQASFDLAYRMNPGVPVFSSETYPGWLTHWGESWQRPDTADLLKEIRFLMDTHKSFNLYVVHGGTNFGFTAGANSGGKGYEPDVTSYDYDAPINEQGQPTAKFFAIRKVLENYLAPGTQLPGLPEPVPTTGIDDIVMHPYASVWEQLPKPVFSIQPVPFEELGQNQGFMLYKTRLIGQKSGILRVKELHDYATVFLNGVYLGKLDRREGISSIEIPKTETPDPTLELLVEGMGHINFGTEIIDRKGITERVTLDGMTMMNWEIYKLPMDEATISVLKPANSNEIIERPGVFFKGDFVLTEPADTYLDMSKYTKGIVWINGHNLGRYWDIGPQKQLYCPASWLISGNNTLLIFDLHQMEARQVKGVKMLQ